MPTAQSNDGNTAASARSAGTDRTPASSGTLNDPRTIRILKFAVVTMGIILIVGLVTVAARIMYLYLTPRDGTIVSSPHSQFSGPPKRLTLPQGAVVKSMSLSGDRIAIYFETTSGTGIKVVNTRTGAVESAFDLRPDVPTR